MSCRCGDINRYGSDMSKLDRFEYKKIDTGVLLTGDRINRVLALSMDTFSSRNIAELSKEFLKLLDPMKTKINIIRIEQRNTSRELNNELSSAISEDYDYHDDEDDYYDNNN
jgi:hypothetical protein